MSREYESRGYVLRETRWRGEGGEIDLIFSTGEEIVFVEVKASDSFESAVAHLGPRQVARIMSAASEYLGETPMGQATPVRFDVALVDGRGQVEILEAAIGP